MRTILLKNKAVRVYDSIDEMPIENFQKFNKYLLIDAGIGSDIDSIDTHISKIAKYINTDKAMAMQELQNMRQNLYMITSNISPKNLAFAALIYDIEGKKVEDLSDDNLKKILDELKSAKASILTKLVASIKKKIQEELELYFPEEFVTAKDKAIYDKLKKRILLVLDGIVYGNKDLEGIREIDDYFLSLHKPISFCGASSAEIKYDKQFETMCMIISQKTNMPAKGMAVLQFYNALVNIKEQVEREQKAYKKNKYRGV